MRYLIQKNFYSEIALRKTYIWETLNLWTIPRKFNNRFVELVSIPSDILDICFIVAHNSNIIGLLRDNDIYEKNIVIISCHKKLESLLKEFTNKSMYICNQNDQNFAMLYDGKQFGFGFDLTESELLFYNTSKNKLITDRLDSSFTKL